VSAVRDALGRPAFLDAVAATGGKKDGQTVRLTIDGSLQFAVEQELKAAVQKARAQGGSVIVMNAVNGEILAMANEPSFNPNRKGAPPSQRRNRVVTDGFEPGSTMKALLLAAALKNGGKLGDAVYGERGDFKVQGRRISEAESHERFEWISLKKMLQVSSNIGAAKLALKLGTEKYQQALRDFGIGSRSGMGFPGEIAGMMPANKRWQPLTLANVGFGHGLLVTPIQMARAYAAFFNGGWLVQPTLVKTSIEGFSPQPPKRIFSQAVADDVVEALLAVTGEGGTGRKAALEGYRVAGKTGTAQKVDPKTGRYSKSSYISSFIGSAVEVEPRLVIFASVDEPRGSIYASETAAPLFRAVLNAAAARFSIPAQAEPARVLASGREGAAPAGAKGVISDRLRTSLAKVMLPPDPAVPAKLEWQGATEDGAMKWKMPSLVGLTPREAMAMLQGRKFQVQASGTGVIRSHHPDEGKVIQDGGTLRLQLGEP
jgi:cell division protein FtsI (penicillin-binding protein 3)